MSNHHSTSTEEVESDQQISQLRNLILGKNGYIVTNTIKKEARHIVGDVLTEALHDRQKKDGSINQVLLPLVQDSVESSVTHHSDKLVSSLYPLMGRLIRKSVTAFLTDFMEKTNQLIENSFTIKGLKWRFIAWQSGVSFSQYVASQIFLYRVDHVFLIHRETGLLLKSVDNASQSSQDADLISSMLTAINDFVGDSFSIDEDGFKEQLQTVSTDTFNLLIKPGPNALVVAAVIGNPPQKVNDQLQITLENIHSLYNDELNDFSGDNELFDNSENLLQDCLLSEQKQEDNNNRKQPWFAWLFVILFTVFIGFKIVEEWNNNQLSERVMKLEHQPGIVIKHLDVIDNQNINLNIFRDPDAVIISDWLKNNNLNIKNVNLIEHEYYSLDTDILRIRLDKILSKYPQVMINTTADVVHLSGTMNALDMETLLNQLEINGYNQGENLNTQSLKLVTNNTIVDGNLKKQLFIDIVGRISTLQLSFSSASEHITPSMELKLQRLYNYMKKLKKLSDEIDINFSLFIIGASDNSGSKKTNETLSVNRAKNTSIFLNNLGLSYESMYVTGLGQVNIKNNEMTTRKVIFNVVYY